MTQEEKDIIYEDACCRLPYRPYAAYTLDGGTTVRAQITGVDELAEYYGYISDTWGRIPNFDIKLYLRPFSSMTEEEQEQFEELTYSDYEDFKTTTGRRMILATDSDTGYGSKYFSENISEVLDWLNAHHFDYRDLIGKGLALEAPEYMYKLINIK